MRRHAEIFTYCIICVFVSYINLDFNAYWGRLCNSIYQYFNCFVFFTVIWVALKQIDQGLGPSVPLQRGCFWPLCLQQTCVDQWCQGCWCYGFWTGEAYCQLLQLWPDPWCCTDSLLKAAHSLNLNTQENVHFTFRRKTNHPCPVKKKAICQYLHSVCPEEDPADEIPNTGRLPKGCSCPAGLWTAPGCCEDCWQWIPLIQRLSGPNWL